MFALVLFDVLTRCGLCLALVVAIVGWFLAGCPLATISRRQ